MLDSAPVTHQRSRGAAEVALDGAGRVVRLFQQGSAKAMLPAAHGAAPEVVYLNTSGGLTGGDRLTFSLDLAPGASALAATQTAERAYASLSGDPARVSVDISVGEGATCLWLPQETILFDRASVHRETRVRLGQGAAFLGVETLVLGRAAMGETVGTLDFTDLRRITDAEGRPIHAEQLRLDGTTLARRAARAGLAGGSVFATLVFVAGHAEDRLGQVRRLIAAAPEAAASAFDGRLVLRVLGDDSWRVRQILAPVIRALGTGALPRVWQM